MDKAAVIFAKNIGHWTAHDTAETDAVIQQIFVVGIYKNLRLFFRLLHHADIIRKRKL